MVKKEYNVHKKELSMSARLRTIEDLMFVDPCIVVQFIQKNPTRRNSA